MVSCAFRVADRVIFICGALPMKKMGKKKSTFTTEHAENLGIWKVPSQEAKDFPIVAKQAELVERLEKNPELDVFSVNPQTDAGMKTVMSGNTAPKRHMTVAKRGD